MRKEILGKTMIGSHIWNMNHKDSDEDYFEIYAENMEDILTNKATYKSTFTQCDGVDTHSHEVSHVIEQLLKGNINYVLGVLSPIIKYKTPEFMELRKIARNNLSKNCFHSINGMSEGNYIKYVLNDKDVTEHKCNQILRAIQFGIILLQKGKVEFKPYTGGTSDEILERLSELQWSHEISPLSETPNEWLFREWLKGYRITQIKDMLEA